MVKDKATGPRLFLKEYAVIILVIIILFSALIRFYSIERKASLTPDEHFYMQLGYQVMGDPTDYSLDRYYERVKKDWPAAPYYLKAPLFKHPPFFPYLIAINFRLFGTKTRSAEFVSLFFGVLTILVVYFIGAFVFDERRGLLSALLLALDPVHLLCSKKIWIETTYVFFVYLGILLLIMGLKKDGRFLILSGISFGIAILNKYFAIMPYVGVLVFVIFVLEDIRLKKYFCLFLIAPAVMILPWFFWNYAAFGNGGFGNFVHNYIRYQYQAEDFSKGAHRWLAKYALIGGAGFAIASAIAVTRIFFDITLSGVKVLVKRTLENAAFRIVIVTFFLIIGVVIIGKILSLDRFGFNYTPPLRQAMDFFKGQPKTFYIDRLTQLTPLYFFSILSLLFVRSWSKFNVLLVLVALPTLFFFSYFGSYESRYILAAIPALIILSSDVIIRIYDKLENSNIKAVKYLKYILVTVVAYFVIKLLRFDFSYIISDVVWYMI